MTKLKLKLSLLALLLSTPVTSLSFPSPSHAFTTVSGSPVCRYALGGAARSTQPSSLPGVYYDILQDDDEQQYGAPFYFYYNPHRYPDFMSGVAELCSDDKRREGLFIASGGTDRSHGAMEQRLQDALNKCGGSYLDLFIVEYACSYELDQVQNAIQQALEWKEQGLVRYVGASTHSHKVGQRLANNGGMMMLDTLMLRYGMSHKDAAEKLSFAACMKHKIPVLAFTTTRWNSLQDGHRDWNDAPPTTGECLSFALQQPVEVILHSARDKDELLEALEGLDDDMSDEDINKWRTYGDLAWNQDGFDEYPKERL